MMLKRHFVTVKSIRLYLPIADGNFCFTVKLCVLKWYSALWVACPLVRVKLNVLSMTLSIYRMPDSHPIAFQRMILDHSYPIKSNCSYNQHYFRLSYLCYLIIKTKERQQCRVHYNDIDTIFCNSSRIRINKLAIVLIYSSWLVRKYPQIHVAKSATWN